MSLNEREAEWLEGLFLALDVAHVNPLSVWEGSFMADQRSRYEQFGSEIRLSSKQWGILMRIAEKADYDAPHGREDENGLHD